MQNMRKLIIFLILLITGAYANAQIWETEYINDEEGQVKSAYTINGKGYMLLISNVDNNVIVAITHK